MTQSSCKRDTKSKIHPSVKLAPVRVFLCKHPLTQNSSQKTCRKLIGQISRMEWRREVEYDLWINYLHIQFCQARK